MVISESTRRFLKSGTDSTGSVVEKMSRTGARNVRPVQVSRDRGQQYNVGSPFERIPVDIAGPFPVTEDANKYIMVVSDYFSKWPESYAISNQEATTVATTPIDNWISRYGVPMEFHSDQGRNFESNLFQTVTEVLGIRKTRTTPLHPQPDGMVEHFRRWWPNIKKIGIDTFHCSYWVLVQMSMTRRVRHRRA